MICKFIHFRLCKKYNINTIASKYWKRNPFEIEENNQVMNLHDYPITTDIIVVHNRPEIVVKDKIQQKCFIIKVGVPFDICQFPFDM